MADINRNYDGFTSNKRDSQWKVDKVRALHTMNDHQEVERVYDEFAEYFDEVRY